MSDHQAMSCPVCRVPLVMSERQGVEIDYCPQCRGVWLDRGELDKVIERSGREYAPAPQAAPQPAPHPRQPQRHEPYGEHGGYRQKRRSELPLIHVPLGLRDSHLRDVTRLTAAEIPLLITDSDWAAFAKSASKAVDIN